MEAPLGKQRGEQWVAKHAKFREDNQIRADAPLWSSCHSLVGLRADQRRLVDAIDLCFQWSGNTLQYCNCPPHTLFDAQALDLSLLLRTSPQKPM